MDGNILGFGADEEVVPVKKEEPLAPVVIQPVEEPWEWVMEGGNPDKQFSPEIEDVLEFGDNSQSWDVEFPSKEYKM